MSRWIEFDDAIERLGAYLMADAQIEWGGTASEDIEDWKELASDILKGSPSTEIIRCRECKYASDDGTYGCMCEHFNDTSDAYHRMWSDDFCSYGEREGE